MRLTGSGTSSRDGVKKTVGLLVESSQVPAPIAGSCYAQLNRQWRPEEAISALEIGSCNHILENKEAGWIEHSSSNSPAYVEEECRDVRTIHYWPRPRNYGPSREG